MILLAQQNVIFRIHNFGELLKKKCQDNKFTKKIFVIGILVNICIFYYYFTANATFTSIQWLFGDLKLNFFGALNKLLTDPQNVYNYPIEPVSFLLSPSSRWPFRSLPALLFYFLPFYYYYQFSSDIISTGFIYSFYLILWNLLSCYLIYEITKKETFKNEQETGYFKNSFILMSIYLLSFNQTRDYFMGNVNIIAGSFILAGLYFYYQKKEHLTYVAWSIACTFKIFVLVLIPFFIFQGPLKRFVKNACCFIIPLLPNLIMFAIWPNWIHDAWNSNWLTVVSWETVYNHSGSIARELSNSLPIPILPLVILFCCLFFPPNLWIAYKNKKLTFLDRFMLAFMTIIVCIPDFVVNHNLLILGAYVLWISSKSSVMTKEIKLFMGIPTVSGLIVYVPYVTLSLFYILCLFLIYLKVRGISVPLDIGLCTAGGIISLLVGLGLPIIRPSLFQSDFAIVGFILMAMMSAGGIITLTGVIIVNSRPKWGFKIIIIGAFISCINLITIAGIIKLNKKRYRLDFTKKSTDPQITR